MNALATTTKESEQEIIGLIPAAGQATRLSPLPCSKELFPVGFGAIGKNYNVIPKVVCHYLLEKMRLARITNAYIVIREGKWDIPTYFGDGSALGLNLAYLMMGLPFGVPYTLDQAYPFVKSAIVALGFPDILFEPEDAFVQVLDRLETGDIDVSLGLCPAGFPRKMDMVDVLDNGRIKRLVIKPEETNLSYSWAVAAWTPVFTNFMHEYLAGCKETAAKQSEMFVGDVFNAAIQEGLRIEGLLISDKPYLDIGTGDDLLRATKRYLMHE
jgi:glucose-1-phosphate thymidylyltransferase